MLRRSMTHFLGYEENSRLRGITVNLFAGRTLQLNDWSEQSRVDARYSLPHSRSHVLATQVIATVLPYELR